MTLESPYTRYPVYRGSLDDIVGILHIRDLFTALHDRGLADVRDRASSSGPPTWFPRRRISPRC